MGLPTPSPTQLAALTALKAVAEAGASGAADKVAALQGALDKQQEVEDFQKETFDVLNDEIIRRYEVERRWIDGKDIEEPIIEDDVTTFASADNSGRLWNGGDFAPLRIPQFDGGPLADLEPKYELFLFDEQDKVLDILQNGIAGQVILDLTANIETALDENSTTVNILEDATAINNGDVLFVSGGGFAALLQITSATAGGSCSGEDNPPQLTQVACEADNGTWTSANSIEFVYLIPPTGTIPASSPIGQKTFDGFNNTERTNKLASDSDFQVFLNGLLSDLESNFNDRKTALNNQLTQIQANQDDNIDPNAETNVQTSISAIDGFLGLTPPTSIDISDTGITAIDDERDVRKPQAQARPGQIATAISSGDFYNLRFNTSEGRCRLNNGSIVLLNDLQEAKTNAQEGGVEAANLASRYDALIP